MPRYKCRQQLLYIANGFFEIACNHARPVYLADHLAARVALTRSHH